LPSDAAASLAVLLTNLELRHRTGTQLVVRDLTLGLARAGHRPMVYSPELGEVAAEIRATGVPVVTRLDALPAIPDIIHGHHHVETVEAMLAFPSVPAIFVCHDRTAWHDVPPRMPGIVFYVAPDENCRERLAAVHQLPAERLRLVPNWVDTARFSPRGDLPARPARALVFSNYAARGGYVEPILAACRERGIALDIAGFGTGQLTKAPERLLPGYDIVFAKARCALEAMAVGCAVVLCDSTGLGPLVELREIERLRAWNFGMRLLTEPATVEGVAARLAAYDPAAARTVRDWIRTEATLEHAVASYLSLYREALAVAAPSLPSPPAERLRAYLVASAAAAARFERLTALDGGTGQMAALTPAECAQIALDAALDARLAFADERLVLRVTVENRAARPLSSQPPYPVHLVCGWEPSGPRRGLLTPRAAELRWHLAPPVPPGGRSILRIEVPTPRRSGRYRLRLSLVQPEPGASRPFADIAAVEIAMTVLPKRLGLAARTLARRAAASPLARRLLAGRVR
jgi:hypothetical protein